ncbi:MULTISPECIES: hypothetical protein [Priestia]|nr:MULTISPECIES: hypothetical protein [Priestia]MCR8866069.1 hypothetical protein [Priestia megaterium]MDC7783607.1 hypothetical protein [Priestia megaterium]MDN3232986.1 hypothetical protein [Priestia megaterium]MDR4221466.1 hypothetical protein [Priestia megaterium]MDR7206556.1 hypothetical protein [Priestia megaterium]
MNYIKSDKMSYLAGTRKDSNLLPEFIWDDNCFKVLSYKLIIRKVIPVTQSYIYPPQSYERVNKTFKDYIAGMGRKYDECFCPLYIFTYKETDEKLTWYVGETNQAPTATTGRMYSGHHAIPQLTDDYFSKKDKEIYILQVFLSYCHEGREYIDVPLEWIDFERTEEELKSTKSKDKYKKITKIVKYLEWVIMERAAAAKNSDREIPKNIEDFEVEANYIEIFFEDGRPIDIDLQAVYESILEEELIKEVYELRNC